MAVDKLERKKARPLEEGPRRFLCAEQLPRRAHVAAILANAVRGEIVPAAASEAGLVIQRDAVRPFGSPRICSARVGVMCGR